MCQSPQVVAQSAVNHALWSGSHKFESLLPLPLCGHVKKKIKKQCVKDPVKTDVPNELYVSLIYLMARFMNIGILVKIYRICVLEF